MTKKQVTRDNPFCHKPDYKGEFTNSKKLTQKGAIHKRNPHVYQSTRVAKPDKKWEAKQRYATATTEDVWLNIYPLEEKVMDIKPRENLPTDAQVDAPIDLSEIPF